MFTVRLLSKPRLEKLTRPTTCSESRLGLGSGGLGMIKSKVAFNVSYLLGKWQRWSCRTFLTMGG